MMTPPLPLSDKGCSVLFLLTGISFLVLTACSGSGGGANSEVDIDNDGISNLLDIDDDGDGLIEIATAAELDSVRYALNGKGRRLSAGAALDTTGCGGDNGIRFCNGYELVADISLATYANADGGKGWQPLGHDTDSSNDGCQGVRFEGTFEGNGWTISDLNISRSDENCVGLFGHIAAGSEIRNLALHAETVIGKDRVGGLVGRGPSAQIISSSVVVNEVSGTGDYIGGLVGVGTLARIVSSSVVAGQVKGFNSTGGLVGRGDDARIHSSSAVLSLVIGEGHWIGGLVGVGGGTRIYSSSVVVDEVSGSSSVGGLVGWGREARIHSSLVVVGEIGKSRSSRIGGLVGYFEDGKVAYSYVVSGSNTAMLVGSGSGIGAASYWDSETSGINSGDYGVPKTSNELRSPTGYERIYANWNDWTDIFGGEDELLAVWCDKDNSGTIEADEQTNDNLVWDFGTSSEYPAIRCTPITPAGWRSWWSLDGNGKPQLDQTRLDTLFSEAGIDNDNGRDNGVTSDCSNSIAEVDCNITLGGITEEFLGVGDRDYFVVDLEEAGTLSLWILGSLDINVSLLNEEEASRLRNHENTTTRPYDTNYVGDQYFYELAAGRHYLAITNEGPPISFTLVTSFLPTLIDSCGSTWDTACRFDNLTNSARKSIDSINGSIYPINDSDMFEINITKAGRLTVWLESQLDSQASLLGEHGNQLAYDNNSGYGYDFRISHTFYSYELGLYYLNITSIFSLLDYPRFGPYELFVRFLPMGEEQKCELAEGRQPSRDPDPLLAYQWYLDRIGVKEVWAEGHEGQGVHISIVDDGLDMMHEDLRQNIIANASRNYLVEEDHPSRHSPLPPDCWPTDDRRNPHGTATAGVAAARGDNGLGIKGVAPKAGIYMANYLQYSIYTSLMDAWSPKTSETLVSVNSWGSGSHTRLTKARESVLETIEEHLDPSFNRGISYVISAGNHRVVRNSHFRMIGSFSEIAGPSEDMATYEEINNHRGTIPVCATNRLDSYASFSNPGINLWVCAPGQGGIATTDLTGRAGYNQGLAAPPLGSSFADRLLGHYDFGSDAFYYQQADYRSDYVSYDGNLIAGLPGTDAYYRYYGGTSAAAPMLGGVIALIRSAYPALTWRDTKLILAESAEQLDASAASWQRGGTAYHDTRSHYTHSIDYGFGLVDAAASLDLAAQWQALPPEIHNETIEKTIPFGPVNIEDTIRIGDIGLDFIEHVQLEINSSYADFGHLDIELISPRGTRSLVARRHICARRIGERDCADLEGGFTFASAAHLGEDPQGIWILRVSGATSPTQFDWNLRFYGHKRRS